MVQHATGRSATPAVAGGELPPPPPPRDARLLFLQVADLHAAALAEDASVFDYDGHYDSIQEVRLPMPHPCAVGGCLQPGLVPSLASSTSPPCPGVCDAGAGATKEGGEAAAAVALHCGAARCADGLRADSDMRSAAVCSTD